MVTIYKQIGDFINFSQDIGHNIAYFQGGGGNISCKVSLSARTLILIKASGFKVRDMAMQETGNKGWTLLEYNALIAILNLKTLDQISDRESGGLLRNAIVSEIDGTKLPITSPSMETWFHALLSGRYIIHSHSVYVNVATCSEEGAIWIRDKLTPAIIQNFNLKYGNIVWIDYVTPGIKLAIKIKAAIEMATNDLSFKDLPNQDETKIIFLANHGVIVSGKDSQTVLAIHEFINSKIRALLKLTEFTLAEFASQDFDLSNNTDLNYSEILIPDLAVYSQKPRSDNLTETYAGHRYILNKIQAIGFTPRYLSLDAVGELLGMESEKYRSAIQ